ncbi:hypothetical protein [Streptomonospora salina]
MVEEDGDTIPLVCILPVGGNRQDAPAASIMHRENPTDSVIMINSRSTRADIRSSLLALQLNEGQLAAVSGYLNPGEESSPGMQTA